MQKIKTFLFDRFNILFPLFLLTVLSIFLLTIRMKITYSFFYLFLSWNLFLAMIPFFISTYIKTKQQLTKHKPYFLLIVWILFLPNAPYLLTDFIHLRLSPSGWIGFDGLMISVFAITGITYYIFSIRDIEEVLLKNFSIKLVSMFMAILPFMVSFGMYLGRVLRWNSWDLLHTPFGLLMDIFAILTNPIDNLQAWLFTIFLVCF